MMNVVEIVSEKIKEYIQKFLNYAALLTDEQIKEGALFRMLEKLPYHFISISASFFIFLYPVILSKSM